MTAEDADDRGTSGQRRSLKRMTAILPILAMPLTRRVARFNRRVTNRLTRHIAWWAPGFAIVTHVGRSSGRVYHTPVNVFRRDGRYVFALTYGRDADRVRNVLAAGRCKIETRRQTVELTNPELFTDRSRRQVPPPPRWILRAAGVYDFLRMTRASTEAASAAGPGN
jgi:deazaflavin-dependent oxidoreductase (nitroreductase family)